MSRAGQPIGLQGWYVISTRPLGQHGSVRRCAARLGASTFALSTLSLEPLDAGVALARALRCPRILVTSPAAARALGGHLAPLADTQWFTLGAGSAATLRRAGAERVHVARAGSDSEALLAHPLLQAVEGADIGLITAPDGRGLLAASLRARGATVHVAEVYRRQARPLSRTRLRALAQLPATSAVLLTSRQAFDRLWQGLDAQEQKALTGRTCVVASVRLADYAAGLGFATVVMAATASPRSLIAALADHVGNGRFR